MKQAWVHLVALSAIAAGAVALIRQEGRLARQTVREAVREDLAAGAEAAAERAVDRAGEMAGSAIRGGATSVLEEAGRVAATAIGGRAPVDRSEDARADRPAPRERESAAPLLTDPVGVFEGLVRTGSQVAEALDQAGQRAFGLSAEEEREAGREIHREMLRAHRVVRDPALQARIERLLAPLLERRRRREVEYTVTVLDAAEVNASSHLGGYLYVNRGLIEHARADAELQFVLGHEVAHVDLGHCGRGMTYAARASEVLGDLGAAAVQHAYHLVALGHSEAQEFEADAWSLRALLDSGRSAEEALAYPRRHAAEDPASRDLPRRGRPSDAAEAAVRAIEGHFASHPPGRERLERLERLASRAR